MSSCISKRMLSIKQSQTLEIASKTRKMKSDNIDVISLGVGESEFDTPIHVKYSAIKSIVEGDTKYTDVGGKIELREAICKKFSDDYNLSYNSDEVIVSAGAKQVLFNLFFVTLNPAEEVILIKPYWNSYVEMVNAIGGKVVFVDSVQEDNFSLNLTRLEASISDKTKWILLNYPNNPTGKILLKNEIEGVILLLKKYPHVNLILDEIYEYITFNSAGEYCNFQSYMKNNFLKDRIFFINGVSKTYSMTGWRIGYGVGNSDIIKAMRIIQSHTTSNPSSISQAAALSAIVSSKEFIQVHLESWRKKRDILFDALVSIKGVKCSKSQGAFYLFPDFSYFLGQLTKEKKEIKTSVDLSMYLLESAKISTIPGEVFGKKEHLRFSYAVDEKKLDIAVSNLLLAMKNLSFN